MLASSKSSLRSSSKLANSIRLKSTNAREPALPKKLGVTPNKYNSKSSAFNLKENLPEGLYYHPAPSSRTPEMTPKAFLPDSDPRKTSKLYFPEENKLVKKNIKYMPKLSAEPKKRDYNLTKKEVEEIQAMRDAGVPRREIREKFGVSNMFIGITTNPNPDTLAKQQEFVDSSVKKWSKGTKNARVLKEKQKALWARE